MSSAPLAAPTAAELYWRGVQASQAGQVEAALEVVRQSLQLEPRQAPAWYLLARLHEARDDLPAAYQALDQTLRYSRRQHQQALLRLGRLYELDANLGRARASYEQACALPDASAVACWQLARVLREQGQRDTALWAVNQALRKNPKLASAHDLRGLIQLEQRRPDKAREDFAQALALRPEFSEARANLAAAHYAAGDLAAALLEARAVLRTGPHPRAAALEQRVLADLELGNGPASRLAPLADELEVAEPDALLVKPRQTGSATGPASSALPTTAPAWRGHLAQGHQQAPELGQLLLVSPQRWVQARLGPADARQIFSAVPGRPWLVASGLPAGQLPLEVVAASGQVLAQATLAVSPGRATLAQLKDSRLKILSTDLDPSAPPAELKVLTERCRCNILINYQMVGSIGLDRPELLVGSMPAGTHLLTVQDDAGKVWVEGLVILAPGRLTQVTVGPGKLLPIQ